MFDVGVWRGWWREDEWLRLIRQLENGWSMTDKQAKWACYVIYRQKPKTRNPHQIGEGF